MKRKHRLPRAPLLATVAVLACGLPPPQVHAGSPARTLAIGEQVSFDSQILGEERTMRVAFPAGYADGDARYPVLYVLDGEFFFYQAHAAVQFLSECTYLRTPPLPRMIVVGIVNVDRNRDFTPTAAPIQGDLRYPTSGGAAKFLAFLQEELIPFVDARYRTQPYRVLAGWSFGGLFTVTTLLDHPDAFSAYLAISPSLWWEGDRVLARAKTLVEGHSLSQRPLVVTLGALEGGPMGRSVRKGLVPLLQTARAGHAFSAVTIASRDHFFSPYQALLDGLMALFADWALPNGALSGGFDSVKRFYEQLSVRVGYTVEVPESAFQALVGSLLSRDDDAAALRIARLACERFPASSRAFKTLGVVQKRTGDLVAARETLQHAIDVERNLAEPDSERIMDVRLQLWLLDQEAPPPAPTTEKPRGEGSAPDPQAGAGPD